MYGGGRELCFWPPKKSPINHFPKYSLVVFFASNFQSLPVGRPRAGAAPRRGTRRRACGWWRRAAWCPMTGLWPRPASRPRRSSWPGPCLSRNPPYSAPRPLAATTDRFKMRSRGVSHQPSVSSQTLVVVVARKRRPAPPQGDAPDRHRRSEGSHGPEGPPPRIFNSLLVILPNGLPPNLGAKPSQAPSEAVGWAVGGGCFLPLNTDRPHSLTPWPPHRPLLQNPPRSFGTLHMRRSSLFPRALYPHFPAPSFVQSSLVSPLWRDRTFLASFWTVSFGLAPLVPVSFPRGDRGTIDWV